MSGPVQGTPLAMTDVVRDASVVMKWYVPEVYSIEARRFLTAQFRRNVPALLLAEVGQTIWKKVHLRREISADDGKQIRTALLATPLVPYPFNPRLGRLRGVRPAKSSDLTPRSRRASQRDRRFWIITALTLLVALQTVTPAWAWGRLGHRVIARIAEKHLNSKAKVTIAELLEPGESLADASTWADENRRRLPKTAPWHYVDVPLDEPHYDARFSGDVATKGCIVDKIHEFQATLIDPSRSVEDRRFALRFLIHLVQDLHMPLHVGENHNKGGNLTQVRFFSRGSNMHRLWGGQDMHCVLD